MILQSEVSTENKHILRKIFLVIFILLIGGAIGAVATSYFLAPSPTPVPKCFPADTAKESSEESYQAGFDAARKLVEESAIGQVFRSPDEIHAVAGTVMEISGNKILIRLNSSNPFDDPKLLDRTIIIGDVTNITNATPVIDEKNVSAPITYIYKKAAISDIKVGSYISTITTDNVKAVAEFTPNEVQILKW